MSSKRSEDLENFFGVSATKLQNQVSQAQQKAQSTSTTASSNINANINPQSTGINPGGTTSQTTPNP